MKCRQCGHEMHEYTQTGFSRTSSTGTTVVRPDVTCVTCKNPDCDNHGPYNLGYQTFDKSTYPERDFTPYLKKEVCE